MVSLELLGVLSGCVIVYAVFFAFLVILRRYSSPALAGSSAGNGGDQCRKMQTGLPGILLTSSGPQRQTADEATATAWKDSVGLNNVGAEFLHLNGLVVGNAQLALVCKQLRSDNRLHTLNLGCNGLGVAGVGRLSACLRDNTSLRSLQYVCRRYLLGR